MTITMTPEVEVPAAQTPRRRSATTTLSQTAETVASKAADAAERLPEAAAAARAAFDDASRRINESTDEMLRLGTSVSFGFAIGLLIGGASRLLVAIAFVPVAMMGVTLLERGTAGSTVATGGGPRQPVRG
jgi:hypothetical protein